MTQQTILLTGASSGFGKAIVEYLARLEVAGSARFKIIGIARRADKLQQLADSYNNFIPLVLDLTDLEQLESTIQQLLSKEKIDVLINNAGLALGIASYQEQSWQDINLMIQTNLIAPSKLIHLVLAQMKQHNQGYIINLSSIAAHYAYPGGNVYGATKAYLTQLSRNLRSDLLGTQIRVTSIEPGMAGDTEFSQVRFKGDQDKVAQLYNNVDYLRPQDIAQTVEFLLNLEPHVNVNQIELMPVAQAPQALAVMRNKI